MTTTTLDQIDGFSGSRALKEPVRLATTGDIVLEGLLTIDGTVTAEGDRVLVKDQATPSQNGIYIASSGVWSRAVDMDTTGKAVKGTQVWVTDGATLAGTLWIVSAANPIVIDTSSLTWQSGTIYQAAAAMAAAIIAATAKATPANADRFGYVDDATGQLRQMTWAEQIAAMLPGAAASQYVRRNAGNTAYEHRSAAQVLSDIGGVAKAGDTMTGDLNVSKATPAINLNAAAAGQQALLNYLTAGVSRWTIFKTSGTESGANAGSDLQIGRYSDAGSFLANVLTLNRASGLVTLESGQLKFPATANPSTNQNTLDDYEEGTWTPQPAFGGASVGMTFSTRIGRYTKIGNRVLLETYIVFTAKGSSTGAATVTGLPFAESASGLVNVMQVAAFSAASLTAGFSGYIQAGGTGMQLLNPNTTGASNSSDANFGNSTSLLISGNYTTNS